jgi:hypothetical protein
VSLHGTTAKTQVELTRMYLVGLVLVIGEMFFFSSFR